MEEELCTLHGLESLQEVYLGTTEMIFVLIRQQMTFPWPRLFLPGLEEAPHGGDGGRDAAGICGDKRGLVPLEGPDAGCVGSAGEVLLSAPITKPADPKTVG